MSGPALTRAQREELMMRILDLGHARGLTSERKISEQANLGAKGLGDIKTGTGGGPKLATLLAICKAVGAYSIDDLLGPSASTIFWEGGSTAAPAAPAA